MKLDRGTIVLLDLDPARGHEQKGLRPGAIVSDPDVTEDQRFPMLCIVPITGTAGAGALYPRLQPGASGLRKRSFVVIDQIRSVDKRRVRRVFGRVTPAELEAIDGGLRLYLGLTEPQSSGGTP